MDLKNIDIKIESEDQAFIMLFFLRPSYNPFADMWLHEKDNISLDGISDALKSKELKKSFLDNRNKVKGLATEVCVMI